MRMLHGLTCSRVCGPLLREDLYAPLLSGINKLFIPPCRRWASGVQCAAMNFKLLKQLSEASGVPGHEGRLRDLVRAQLRPHVDRITTDAMGNVIGFRAGSGKSGPRLKVMLAAHMDELGLLVRRITPEGYLKFQTLGGWLDQAIVNQRWFVLTSNGPV